MLLDTCLDYCSAMGQSILLTVERGIYIYLLKREATLNGNCNLVAP